MKKEDLYPITILILGTLISAYFLMLAQVTVKQVCLLIISLITIQPACWYILGILRGLLK